MGCSLTGVVAMATRGVTHQCDPHLVKVHEVEITYHMGSVGLE